MNAFWDQHSVYLVLTILHAISEFELPVLELAGEMFALLSEVNIDGDPIFERNTVYIHAGEMLSYTRYNAITSSHTTPSSPLKTSLVHATVVYSPQQTNLFSPNPVLDCLD